MCVCVCVCVCVVLCLNIRGTYVTANKSTYNNIEFFFLSDLKIFYYNNVTLNVHDHI